MSPRVAVVALAAVAGFAALAALGGCKQPSRDEGAARVLDATAATRARPAELVHVTLKVLGMT